MQLGMSTASLFGRQYTEEALVTLGAWGIPLCEVFLDTYSEYRPAFASMLREIANRAHLRVGSIHAFCTQFEPQLFSNSPRQQKDAYRILDDVLIAATLLGATSYVFHGVARRGKAGVMQRTFCAPEFAEQLNAIAEHCRSYGVRLAVENVCWCSYNMPGMATQLRRFGMSDNLYFTLDIKQAILSGAPVDEYLDDMGDRLDHVHLCDYRENPNGMHPRTLACLPGDGNLDIGALLLNLRRRGFEGNVILEVYTDSFGALSELQRSYAHVQKLMEQIDVQV